MTIRTKFIAIVGALLGNLFIQVGSAVPGWAHPGHDHAPSVISTSHDAVHAPAATEIVVAESVGTIGAAIDDHLRVNDIDRTVLTVPGKTPQPVHPSNCCCGSIACHSGVAAAPEVIIPRETYRGQLELLPVLAMSGAMLGGIERPPRNSAPL